MEKGKKKERKRKQDYKNIKFIFIFLNFQVYSNKKKRRIKRKTEEGRPWNYYFAEENTGLTLQPKSQIHMLISVYSSKSESDFL